MITNLFRIFDPASSIHSYSNWMRALSILLVIPPIFWLIPNQINLFIKIISSKLFQEISILLGPSKSIGSPILFISLLTIIIFNNFLGLFPYIFTRTSHILHSLTLSLPLWISFIIYGWFNFYNHILAHLVPQRTPNALISFIVLIETIRNIIRPLTLAVRLSANIIAGHLLITLLGNQTSNSQFITLYILLLTQIILLTLECAVAIIQSYVFAVLSSLYSRESSY
jgi:F-type H+-transporting ATPase subunit a